MYLAGYIVNLVVPFFHVVVGFLTELCGIVMTVCFLVGHFLFTNHSTLLGCPDSHLECTE